MLKLFLTSFLKMFVQTVLESAEGKTILNGKAEVVQIDENGTKINLNLGASSKYKITVKKVLN